MTTDEPGAGLSALVESGFSQIGLEAFAQVDFTDAHHIALGKITVTASAIEYIYDLALMVALGLSHTAREELLGSVPTPRKVEKLKGLSWKLYPTDAQGELEFLQAVGDAYKFIKDRNRLVHSLWDYDHSNKIITMIERQHGKVTEIKPLTLKDIQDVQRNGETQASKLNLLVGPLYHAANPSVSPTSSDTPGGST